jgi:large subunit ribosomal protein L7/L12
VQLNYRLVKAVKEACGLGLKEAKDLVDGAPSYIERRRMSKDEAEALKKLSKKLGAEVRT